MKKTSLRLELVINHNQNQAIAERQMAFDFTDSR